jgi:uncharacterized membrane protein
MLLRAVAFGAATGGRTFAPLVALALTRPTPTAPRATALLLGGGELVADKLARTPSRTEPSGLLARAVTSGIGAGVLTRRAGADPYLPVVVAAITAIGAAYAGRAYRGWIADRGWPDLPAAVAEDAWSWGLAMAAARD